MIDASSFTKLMPGFDFLQNLMQGAGQAVPAMGQWIAPTLNPEELEKRIAELKTVQFWLEQNARMLSATIQALEVQRMTLSTLQTMNLPMADLRNALALPTLSATPPKAPAPQQATPAVQPPAAEAAATSPAKPGAVDPMQWWGALTQQFTELATQAMQDGSAGIAKNLSGAVAKAGALDKVAAKKTAPATSGASAKAAPTRRR
jgi:hypothetical protein